MTEKVMANIKQNLSIRGLKHTYENIDEIGCLVLGYNYGHEMLNKI